MTKLSRLFVSTLIVVAATSSARADDVRVYAAGAVQKAIEAIVPAFEVATGHKIVATFDTVGALATRVRNGDKPHLVLLSAQALEALSKTQHVAAPSITAVGRTGVGLAGSLTAPAADISTPEALKATLRAAPSIVHADPARGATAGTHFAKVLAELGLADDLRSRITVVPFGGTVAGDVAAGKFAIGVSQASEIVPNPNVRFLGFLPEPHALWTVYAVASVDAETPASQAFRVVLLGDPGKAALAKIGFQR